MRWNADIGSLRAEMAQYQAYRVVLETEIARINAILAMYDGFPGWPAFCKGYLEDVRLRQIERECATRIGESDSIRTRLSGQRDEILFLIQSKSELSRNKDVATANINAVDEKIAKLNKKIERASNARTG